MTHITKQRQLTGFTLIELLVVISIIALLLAILLPTLQQARESSKGVACKSNVRSIGIAWRMYLDDYDGFLMPAYTNYIPGHTQSTRWPTLTNPYLDAINNGVYQDDGVFSCPSLDVLSYSELNVQYGMNGFGVGCRPGSVYRIFHEREIEQPSNLIAFIDSYFTHQPPHDGVLESHPYTYWEARHLDHANVIYADLHVESHDYDELYRPTLANIPPWGQ